MSILGSWLWGTSQLDFAIDKATSELLPSGAEDIALNLEICDQIRSKSVSAKDAMRGLKRRLNHSNPNVQLLTLSLTDTCVKNGGDLFLNEIASREFMDNLVSILNMQNLHHEVKSTILKHIQNWSIAFEGKPNLSYVGQVYKNLQQEDWKFPPKDPSVVSSAMVDTQTAPEWIDSDVCLRCRTPFTFTNRKHHCRNCGQVFDQQCSSKAMALPHFGITQEVRVCEGCYSKLTKKALKTDRTHKHSSIMGRGVRDLDDNELQRAIKLSLRESSASGSRPGYVPAEPEPSQWHYSEPPIIERPSYSAADEDDPDLKAAIEASLREANAPKPSAPTPGPEESQTYSYDYTPSSSTPTPSQPPLPKLPNYELEPLEVDAILTFNQTVEQLQAQGGHISRYPGVNELYDKANGIRPKLALCLDDTGRKEQMLTDMHDKLSQAVKLYDQLLTEQVMHPRWRPQPINGVASGLQPQWTGSTQAPTDGRQPQYSPQQAYAQPVPWATWYPAQQQAQYSPNTPMVPLQPVGSPPHQQQFSEPLPYQYASSTPTPANIYAHVPMQQHSTPVSIVAATAKSPPPPSAVAHYDAPAPPTPNLSSPLNRSYTISSTHTPSSTTAQHSRSNTISHAAGRTPVQQQHVRNQTAPHQIYIASPPAPPAPTASTLPHFPSAPTALPQAQPTYGSSIPANVGQRGERKEALLIEL
ncbi:hypothetical protein AX15_001073 [Amanita polypyramis BW_CC]|nr:hypothetical protein AX15_001073 [Amanita polypyramis BW_CC]